MINCFFLQVLLTRASLLALAKSIYYSLCLDSWQFDNFLDAEWNGKYLTLLLLPFINRCSVFVIIKNNYHWMFARCLYGYCQTVWWEEENICFQEVDVGGSWSWKYGGASKVHCGTPRIPGSLNYWSWSCMAIKAAVWCLGKWGIRS